MAVTPAQKRIRAQEIHEFLTSLPCAEHSPMINYDLLVKELSTLQRFLKAFFAFLTKLSLNPAKSLRWWHRAYDNVTVDSLKVVDSASPLEAQTYNTFELGSSEEQNMQPKKKKIRK